MPTMPRVRDSINLAELSESASLLAGVCENARVHSGVALGTTGLLKVWKTFCARKRPVEKRLIFAGQMLLGAVATWGGRRQRKDDVE